MLVKCPRCKTMFDENLNMCPVCKLERHVLSLAQKNEIEKAELLKAETKRLEIEKQEKERTEREREEYAKAAPEREAKAREEAAQRENERLEAEKLSKEKAEIERAEREELNRQKLEETETIRLEREEAALEEDNLVELEAKKQTLEKRKQQLEEQAARTEKQKQERAARWEEAKKKEASLEESINIVKEEEKALPLEKKKSSRKKFGKKSLIFALVFLLIAGMGAFAVWKIITKAAEINVQIISKPAGAEIYLNNIATGLKTPATLKNIKIGDYALTLKLEGYEDLATTLSVVAKNKMTDPAIFNLLRKVIPPLKIEVAPISTGVRTMLPIRPIVEAIGGTIQWVIPDKEVQISANGVVINLWINKDYDNGNGVHKPLDSTDASIVPTLVNGRTLLPIKFINEQLGITVVWDEATKEATIQFKN